VVRARSITRQRVAKHIPVEANAQNNRASIARQRPQYAGNSRITSVAMQRAANTTIKVELFSMWFAYIHCWATDIFSMDPPRDYVSGTELNQIRMKRMRMRTRMERVLGSH
jgi:hypothetical protein